MNTAQILGFKRVEVTLRDGKTEEVQVRELTLGELTDRWASWRLSMSDLPKLLDLVCDKPKGWADQICLTSCMDLLAAADDLNQSFFGLLAAKQNQHLRQIMPGLAERLLSSGSAVVSSTPAPTSPTPAAD